MSDIDDGLRPLQPPVAFGDWRRFTRLVWVLAKTDLRQRYASAILGYLWTMFEPLLTFVVLYLVLDRVITFGESIQHYAAFLLMNIILFFFFRDATSRGYRPIRAKAANLMRKMEFPRGVLPISIVVSTGMSYLAAVPALLAFLLISGVQPMWTWGLLPVVVLALFLFACGTVLVLAAVYARIADLEHLWRAVIRVQFWATPVIFAISTIPAIGIRDLILINPLSLILSQAQIWMIDPGAPTVADVAGGHGPVFVSLGIFAATCIVGPLAFASAARSVAERV